MCVWLGGLPAPSLQVDSPSLLNVQVLLLSLVIMKKHLAVGGLTIHHRITGDSLQ